MSEGLKPVLIAGAGPTGMMAAIELSRFNIPVRLIDKNDKPETTSRAVAVDGCGGMSERTERAVLRQIEAAGAITTSLVSIGTKLAPDFTTDPGKELFSIVQKLRLT